MDGTVFRAICSEASTSVMSRMWKWEDILNIPIAMLAAVVFPVFFGPMATGVGHMDCTWKMASKCETIAVPPRKRKAGMIDSFLQTFQQRVHGHLLLTGIHSQSFIFHKCDSFAISRVEVAKLCVWAFIDVNSLTSCTELYVIVHHPNF